MTKQENKKIKKKKERRKTSKEEKLFRGITCLNTLLGRLDWKNNQNFPWSYAMRSETEMFTFTPSPIIH